MIEISRLDGDKDVGKWVRYRDAHFPEQSEIGRISSWNDRTVFVVYKCDNQWHRFKDFTAAGTNPEDLDFIKAPRETVNK